MKKWVPLIILTISILGMCLFPPNSHGQTGPSQISISGDNIPSPGDIVISPIDGQAYYIDSVTSDGAHGTSIDLAFGFDPCAFSTCTGAGSSPYIGYSGYVSGTTFYDNAHTHQYTGADTLIPNAGTVYVSNLSGAVSPVSNIGQTFDGSPVFYLGNSGYTITNSDGSQTTPNNPNTATIGITGVYAFSHQAPPRNQFTYNPSGSVPSHFLGWDVVYMVGATQNSGLWYGGSPVHVYYPGYSFDTRTDCPNPSYDPINAPYEPSTIPCFGTPNQVTNSVPSNASYILAAHVMYDAPYSISGTVWKDSNSNNVLEGGEGVLGGALSSSGTVTSGETASATSDSSGAYSLSKWAGSYNITESGPSGYTSKVVSGNSNPRSILVPASGAPTPAPAYTQTTTSYVSQGSSGGEATVQGTNGSTVSTGNVTGVNFQLVATGPPTCSGGLTAVPTTIKAGSGTVALSLLNCTPLVPTPTYTWPQPTPAVGTTSSCSTSSCTYTPPLSACSQTPITQGATISNSNGATSYSTGITVLPNNIVSGTVYTDNDGSSCATSATVKSNVTMSLIDGTTGNTIGSPSVTTSSGGYSLTDTQACSNQHIIVGGQTIKRVRTNGSTWDSSGFLGQDYGPFTFASPTKTVDFCVGGQSSWFQTTTGDVRFVNLENSLPAGFKATNDTINPSVYFSSTTTPDFGLGTASSTNWQVGREYSYAQQFSSGKGAISYDFYLSRAKQQSITVTPVSASTVDLSSPTFASSGVYQLTAQNPQISASSAISSKHLVILAKNDATITGNIIVTAGTSSLLIIASHGNLTIDPSIGTTANDDTTTQLEGYYSAQGNIILPHDPLATCSSVTDKRLNVAGALISNSVYPFASGGGGQIINSRTLCSGNATNPVLKVYQRLDFLTQLTDFYKTNYRTFREVQP